MLLPKKCGPCFSTPILVYIHILQYTIYYTNTPIHNEDVIKAINNLNNTDATGEDGITVAFLKLSAPVIALPLARLTEISFQSGLIPKAFKSAIVVPIFKGKGKPVGSPSSYRPIAILPALSKVLEKLVLSQLMPFLDPKLPSSQFGFRPGRGTSDAIATAHSSWTKAASAEKVTGIAAFDLTAAFDTVDHNILCGKLEALGFSPSATKWFHDYLIGRSTTRPL